MIKNLTLVIIFFLLIGAAHSKTTTDLTQAGVGARPLGMGKAFAAIPGGSNTICFNPAGIGFVSTIEISMMQTKIVNTADYKMYGGVVATSVGNFGINYISVLSPAGYVTTDKNSMAAAPQMAYTGSTYLLSYARNLNQIMKVGSTMGNLAFGMNIKIVRNYISGITNGNGTGMDGDIGILMLTPNNYTYGVTLQNFLRGNIAWDSGTKDKLPSILRLGVSTKLKKPNILFALDAENYGEDSHPLVLHTGVEWAATENLAIRFGVDQSAISSTNTVNCITFGVGLKYSGVTIDYAYRQDGQITDMSSHYISLSFIPTSPIVPLSLDN